MFNETSLTTENVMWAAVEMLTFTDGEKDGGDLWLGSNDFVGAKVGDTVIKDKYAVKLAEKRLRSFAVNVTEPSADIAEVLALMVRITGVALAEMVIDAGSSQETPERPLLVVQSKSIVPVQPPIADMVHV